MRPASPSGREKSAILGAWPAAILGTLSAGLAGKWLEAWDMDWLSLKSRAILYGLCLAAETARLAGSALPDRRSLFLLLLSASALLLLLIVARRRDEH